MNSDSLVIIPTYNEKENAESIVRAVLGLGPHAFDILIIDDGSPDGTAQIIKSLQKNYLYWQRKITETKGISLLPQPSPRRSRARSV